MNEVCGGLESEMAPTNLESQVGDHAGPVDEERTEKAVSVLCGARHAPSPALWRGHLWPRARAPRSTLCRSHSAAEREGGRGGGWQPAAASRCVAMRETLAWASGSPTPGPCGNERKIKALPTSEATLEGPVAKRCAARQK
ncbi:hypothetical protein NDU88_004639 [Pleurodeles waltl]|uniref:Uncharacterized protein n=1 Tax=Pleurodeles waltl TaxID=8319 RepID=A0AAV7QDA8_PLEWA|nr:hypothetical protein NDU88_004639 [Pleurodeles waltl]